jgi:hypothetical protein
MANVKKYKGSRIYKEIKSKGYKGGRTSFYFYLKKLKIEKKQKFKKIHPIKKGAYHLAFLIHHLFVNKQY